MAAIAPPMLVLLDASESNLYNLQCAWSESGAASPMTLILGDAGDRALIEEIFATHAPLIVFHAAAFKHVPLMEDHPLAAIANNVFATETLVEAAATQAARVVLLSTDKAVEPASVMGATKRAAEQMVLACRGTALRLGNVLASRDSVAEIFARQIARGGPVTVTDPAARRYFLTLDEAVDLLLTAAAYPEQPALLAPALPATHFIADLAQFMARALAPGRPIAIDFTGLRPGDKETELLWSASDSARPAGLGGLVRIHVPVFPAALLNSSLAGLRIALQARDVAASLTHLRSLVPDYAPSRAVLALSRQSGQRVPQ